MANIEHPTDNGGFSVNHLRVLVYALVEEQSSLISNNTYGHDQEFIKLKNLSSSSTFQFLCQANNALGYGEIGKFDVKTLGEPQSIVHINVSHSNCTSATLQFFSDRAGGIINNQQISSYEFIYGLATDGTENGDNGTFVMKSATKDTSSCPVTTLFDLERNAKYAAVVRELNVYGAGTFSDPVLFKTLCVPGENSVFALHWQITNSRVCLSRRPCYSDPCLCLACTSIGCDRYSSNNRNLLYTIPENTKSKETGEFGADKNKSSNQKILLPKSAYYIAFRSTWKRQNVSDKHC